MISHMIVMISHVCAITVCLEYRCLTMISLYYRMWRHVSLHYRMWRHVTSVCRHVYSDTWRVSCISCDVALHHMWCHVWCHSVISQLCNIIAKTLWYHMWNHRQQRDSSYAISHSFFHIICNITCDITVWYHIISHCDVMRDVLSLLLAQALGQPSPVAAVATSSSSSEAWSTNPSKCPPLCRRHRLSRRHRLHQEWWLRPCLWQLARVPPKLLHCCTASKAAAQQAASVEWSRRIRPCSKEKQMIEFHLKLIIWIPLACLNLQIIIKYNELYADVQTMQYTI